MVASKEFSARVQVESDAGGILNDAGCDLLTATEDGNNNEWQ
jgi:hypothetical protein